MEHPSDISQSRREIPMARSMCWHCQSEVKGEYLCGQCVKVQPLSKELDYFTCLRIPRLLNIDTDAMEKTFYELSRTFHPDFYSNKDESEQGISLGNSALLNAAYRTLKDPIQRAEYLIRLEAGSVKEIRSAPPADLFEEILELQDDLNAFREMSGENDADQYRVLREKLERDRTTLEERQMQMESNLFQKFAQWDALQLKEGEGTSQKEAVLGAMQEILSNRTYVKNIVLDLTSTIENQGNVVGA
jgi:molecular chaperone HscB